MVRANRKNDLPRWFRQHSHYSFEDSAWRRKRNHHNRRGNGARVAEMQRRDRPLRNSCARVTGAARQSGRCRTGTSDRHPSPQRCPLQRCPLTRPERSWMLRPLTGQRIVRVPGIGQRLEAQRAGVDHQEAADQPFAEADDFADRFERHQRADHAGEGAENARLGASGKRAFRRRFGKQAAIGRVRPPAGLPLMRADRRQRAVENADRAGDERLLREKAGVGYEIARGEIVRTVGDEIVARDQGDARCRRKAAPDASRPRHAD